MSSGFVLSEDAQPTAGILPITIVAVEYGGTLPETAVKSLHTPRTGEVRGSTPLRSTTRTTSELLGFLQPVYVHAGTVDTP
jgi:hypothetical protein